MLRRLLVALLCAHAAAGSWSSWWSGDAGDGHWASGRQEERPLFRVDFRAAATARRRGYYFAKAGAPLFLRLCPQQASADGVGGADAVAAAAAANAANAAGDADADDDGDGGGDDGGGGGGGLVLRVEALTPRRTTRSSTTALFDTR